MDEDEDDFLYGGNSEGVKEKTDGAGQEAAAEGKMGDVEVSNGQGAVGGIAQGDEEDDEGEDIETDDSDSDLEIIVDGSVGAGPPVGYNARQPQPAVRPTPIVRPPPSIITSDYTPNARPGQASSANSLAVLAGLEGSTTEQAERVKTTAGNDDPTSMSQLPEGGPPPVPITAPRLDLDPSDQSLMLPPETVDGEPGPLIYHVDPTEFEEKPWRRPGSDLTDWFNYGFNEESWKLWGEKKHHRTVERIDMETNGGRQDKNHETENGQAQDNNDASSNHMSQMPSQQMQAMQAMMGASGMSMPPEQMMAFMGMGPGMMPGMGMGMGGGPMMGMPGMSGLPAMGGMFGQQQNTNSGAFPGNFGGMPNMQMMPQSVQRGPHGLPMRPADDMSIVEGDPSNGTGEYRQASSEINGNEAAAINETTAHASQSMGQDISQAATGNQPTDDQPNAAAPESNTGRGLGVPGAPTGPSRGTSTAQGSSAAPLPSSVPTGPKNPGRRYNDRDTGMGLADSLDYGAGQGRTYREESLNRSRSPDRRKASRSRDVSTDRDRDYERDRGGRDRDEGEGRTSIRIKRDRTTSERDRRRHSSPEDEMERLSKKNTSGRRAEPSRRAAANTTSASERHGSRRGERRRSDSPPDREDDWDRESIDSSASRRRGGGTTTSSSRQQQTQPSGRSSTRSERRRGGDQDSGSETERERKYGRSQARAERRAGRDGDDSKTTTSSRKRGAPEEDASPVRSSSSRKRR